MDVGVSTLRAELATWIARARAGEDVVVTERGIPVARLVAIESAPLLDDLTRRGVLSGSVGTVRPVAREIDRVRASGPVADLVGEQRR